MSYNIIVTKINDKQEKVGQIGILEVEMIRFSARSQEGEVK
nr:MAG TPA: hypothetical protein [Caudoviricetes sp.]